MSKPNPGIGNVARATVFLFVGSVLVPILFAGIWAVNYQVSSVTAQDTQAIDEAARARTEVEKAKLQVETARAQYELEKAKLAAEQDRTQAAQRVAPPVAGAPRLRLPSDPPIRRVTEQQYREERYEVYTPEVDPKTGSQVMKKREVRRVVPVGSASYAASRHPSPHDPIVMQLAGELRAMEEDDQRRAFKLDELRTRLSLEFSQMHENQSEEIKRTEQRLESLKKLHQQRDENRDKIVQRRIDEILGKADDLRWNPDTPNPQPAIRGPAYSAAQPGLIPARPIGIGGTPVLPRNFNSSKQATAEPPPVPQSPSQLVPPDSPRAPDRVNYYGPSAPNIGQYAAPVRTDEPISVLRRQTPKRSTPPMIPGVASTRVDVSTSVISRLFQLARRSASANVELSNAQETLEAYKALRAEGAMPIAEVRKAESKVEQLQHEVDLNKIEFEALAQTLHRDLEFSRDTHQRAMGTQRSISRSENGAVPREKLRDAQIEEAKAAKAYADAKANVQQLEIAREVVNRSSAPEKMNEPSSGNGESESSSKTIYEKVERREP